MLQRWIEVLSFTLVLEYVVYRGESWNCGGDAPLEAESRWSTHFTWNAKTHDQLARVLNERVII